MPNKYFCPKHGGYSREDGCPECLLGSLQEQQKKLEKLDQKFKEIEEKKQKKLIAELSAIENPWAHRSSGMKCQTCMWFVRKDKSDPQGLAKITTDRLGRCRRHAPTINGYPAVFEDDWCGDHKIDENKI